MKYSVFRFTLNYHVHRSQVSVPVFLGDTAVQLYISLTDGGNTYYIEDGCTAVLRGTKPDGKILLQNCLIENNTRIRYDFNEQTTSCEGIVNCEISLYGADGNLLTCPKFIIVVGERVARDDEIIESESERSALDAIFASEASRVAAETARGEAEKKRDDSFQTVFVRYSAYPDGTDFTETLTPEQTYIGVAAAKEAPTDKDAYTWMSVSGGTSILVNGEVVAEFDADTKVERLVSGYNVSSVYISKPDGSTGLLQIGTAYNQVPVRTTNGHLQLPTTNIYQDFYAVPKKYVDDKTNGTGTPIWTGAVSNGDIQVYTQNRFFTVGFDSMGYSSYDQTAYPGTITFKTGNAQIGSGGSNHYLGGTLFPLGDKAYMVSVGMYLDFEYNENTAINCYKQENGSWVQTNDIAVISIS